MGLGPGGPERVGIDDEGYYDLTLQLAQRTLGRQSIFRCFRNQALPGVPEAILVSVDPSPVIDELGYDLVDTPGVSMDETVFESLDHT